MDELWMKMRIYLQSMSMNDRVELAVFTESETVNVKATPQQTKQHINIGKAKQRRLHGFWAETSRLSNGISINPDL